jgi:hypothetical protein
VGLARAKAHGTRLGRRAVRLTDCQFATVATLSVREAARQLGVSPRESGSRLVTGEVGSSPGRAIIALLSEKNLTAAAQRCRHTVFDYRVRSIRLHLCSCT